jgi:iron complex outermembrane receptor protein
LYGKNTEAGVINIITKLPDNEFRGKISGELGEDNKRQAVMNLSGPIIKDNLYLGVAGRYYEKDGYITHAVTGETVDDRQRWSGRVHARWTPGDDLDISFIASRFQYDDGQINMGFTEHGYAMYGVPANEDRQVSSNIEGKNDSSDESLALKAAYNISDAITLTSTTTYREYNDQLEMDWDLSSMTLSHSDKDDVYSKFSQELRIDSKSDRLNWLFGLYYDDDDIDTYMVFDSDYPSMAYINDRNIYSTSYAAFAHLSYLLTDKFNILAGIRYEKSEFKHEERIYNTTTDTSWDDITPKIAFQYRFTPSLMGYASVSKGYRTGGFNMYATDPQYFSYEPEYLWSYEAGFKNTFLDNRISLNGALYYMDISDMQVTQAISPAEVFVTNAAEATSIGGELELTARITNGLSIMAGLGYTHIEFDKFEDALGNYEGNTVPFAPDYTFNIGAQYRHPIGFYARADWVGYGETYFDKENNYSRDPYQLVNAKIGYEADNVDVYLYAKNLFDEEYDSEGYYDGFYTIYSDPREIGLQLVYRF